MTAHRFRSLLILVTLIGLLGTGCELVLLEHTEGRAQWTPLIAVLLAVLACVAYLWRGDERSRAIFRLVMVALVVVAVVGIYFHFSGNLEFERELHPSLRGSQLWINTLRGATPTLSPGVLAQLGLIGLLASYVPAEVGLNASHSSKRTSPR